MGNDRIGPLGPSFPCSLMPQRWLLSSRGPDTHTCWTQYCIQLGLKLLFCKLDDIIQESLKVGEASEEVGMELMEALVPRR